SDGGGAGLAGAESPPRFVLALLLLMVPEAGVVVASWLIGLYLLLTGALTIYHAIELRRGLRSHRVVVVVR
ncbi:MAG: DUF308 domain-containing protein, partial [Armatimonadota bacterium]